MVEGWRLPKCIIIRAAGLPAFEQRSGCFFRAPSPDRRNMTCQVLSSSWSIAPASQLARSQQGLGSKGALVPQPLPAQVFKQLKAASAKPRGLRASTAVSLLGCVRFALVSGTMARIREGGQSSTCSKKCNQLVDRLLLLDLLGLARTHVHDRTVRRAGACDQRRPASCVIEATCGCRRAQPSLSARRVSGFASARRAYCRRRGRLALGAVQAKGVPMPSGWRRWKFGDMHKKKKEDRVDKTELFVMLPLDIIGVGELSEGNEVSFIQRYVWLANLLWNLPWALLLGMRADESAHSIPVLVRVLGMKLSSIVRWALSRVSCSATAFSTTLRCLTATSPRSRRPALTASCSTSGAPHSRCSLSDLSCR